MTNLAPGGQGVARYATPAPRATPQSQRFHPVQLDLEAPLEVRWWRVLINPLFAIPLLIVGTFYALLAQIVVLVAWFAILFTARYPKGLFKFSVGVLRFQWRVASYMLFLREPYPSFGISARSADDGSDPATLTILYPRRLSRWRIFVKGLLVLPSLVVFEFVALASFFVHYVGYFFVLFANRWPEGMRRFVVGTQRWGTRITAYLFLLTDHYPGYRLSA